MEHLTFDEIIYITRFLNVVDTFIFLKSIKIEMNNKTLFKNTTKLTLIENIYNTYFVKDASRASTLLTSSEEHFNRSNDSYAMLKEIIEFFHTQLEIEDVICFMANVYPNKPFLKDTILFDLLKLFEVSWADWSLIRVHFKLDTVSFDR
jgi:hypothetical protein